jgi:hypothetical protein
MDDEDTAAALLQGAAAEIRRDRVYRVGMMVCATVVVIIVGFLGARLLLRQQQSLEDRDQQVADQVETAREIAMGAQLVTTAQAERLRDASTERRLLLAQVTTLLAQLEREGVDPIVILPDNLLDDVGRPVDPDADPTVEPAAEPAPSPTAPPPPAPPPPSPEPSPDPSPSPAMWHPDLLPGPPQPAPTPEPTEVVSAVDLTPPDVEYRFPEPPPLTPRPPPMWDHWVERDR